MNLTTPGDALRIEIEGSVARLTLDGTGPGNRFTSEMLMAFERALDLIAQERPKAVVLGAAGPDFCLGRDASGDGNPAAAERSLRAVARIGPRLLELPSVVVVALRGRAVGFGAGLVLHADIVVAARDATLSFDELARGIPPTIVMTYLEDELPRKVAREMLFTGREMGAVEAHERGLVNRVVDGGALDQEVGSVLENLVAADAEALAMCKPYLAGLPAQRRERGDHAVARGVGFFKSRG
jgi:enoyl-CoA hydratase/carnithine racemase